MRHAQPVEEQLAVEAQQDAQRQALHICAERVAFLRKDAHRTLNVPLSHQKVQIGGRPQLRTGIERFGHRGAFQGHDGNAVGCEGIQQREQLGGEDQVLPGGIAADVAQPAGNVRRQKIGRCLRYDVEEHCCQAMKLRGLDQRIPVHDPMGQFAYARGVHAAATGTVQQELPVRASRCAVSHGEAGPHPIQPTRPGRRQASAQRNQSCAWKGALPVDSPHNPHGSSSSDKTCDRLPKLVTLKCHR